MVEYSHPRPNARLPGNVDALDPTKAEQDTIARFGRKVALLQANNERSQGFTYAVHWLGHDRFTH